MWLCVNRETKKRKNKREREGKGDKWCEKGEHEGKTRWSKMNMGNYATIS